VLRRVFGVVAVAMRKQALVLPATVAWLSGSAQVTVISVCSVQVIRLRVLALSPRGRVRINPPRRA
jgi:hypothetical protein